ncbi:exosporium protein ExsK, partial [Klebsiella pneumoniae]|nr:exosporium protein ExsK [Klebsiella pneumoniae]
VNRSVRITTGTNNYAGTVSSVTCDVVKLANSAGVVTVIISVCKIEAIEPLLT